MTYLLTEVADRERLANQARAISLGTWAASILLIGFCPGPEHPQQPADESGTHLCRLWDDSSEPRHRRQSGNA